jgi:hypothetical protein
MAVLEFLVDTAQLAVGHSMIEAFITPQVNSEMNTALRAQGSSSKGVWPFLSAKSSFWFHVVYATDNNDTDNPPMTFRGNGVELFRLVTRSNGDMAAEYHDGTSWTQVGTDVAVAYTSGVQIDIQFVMSDTVGVFDVYFDGVLGPSLAGGDTIFRGESNIDDIYFQSHSNGSSNESYFQEPLLADEDTTKFSCQYILPSADGNYTVWDGGEADVDNLLYQTDYEETSMGSNTADQRQSFSMVADFDAKYDTNHDVIAAIPYANSRKAFNSGLDLRLFTRISATDYDNSNKTVETRKQGTTVYEVLGTDPSTASAWASPAAIEGAEFGVQSRT